LLNARWSRSKRVAWLPVTMIVLSAEARLAANFSMPSWITISVRALNMSAFRA
jgi:hypothetical protein